MAYWRDEEIDTLKTMYAEGRESEEIGKRLGRSRASVDNKLTNLGVRGQGVPVKIATPAQPSVDEVIQQTEAKLSRPTVTPVYQEPPEELDLGMKWAAEAERNRRAIERAQQRSHFTAHLGFEPVGITFISDQHIAPGTPVDMARMMDDAILVRETPNLFACLGGDGVDNHVKHRAAIMAARSQPGDQYRLYEYYLSIFAEKILALISGNHDAWTDQIAGIDMVQQIANRQGLAYCPAECHLTLTLGELEYKVSFRHQYRFNSQFNQTHAVKQWFRNGEVAFDIGCICHHHEATIEPFSIHGLERWACRPGSYQITSAYSRQFGFNLTEPKCPTFIIYPNERRIVGFKCLRDGAKFLKAELAEWKARA